MYLGCCLVCCLLCGLFFFFKQKTAYEMRISDWSSDVCSSDLLEHGAAVNVGNPHIIFFVPEADAVPLAELGPRIESDPLFPERVNVNEIGRASCRERVCQYV